MKDVLIVDDDRAYRKSVVRLFKGKPYRFFEAEAVAEAIAVIEAHKEVRVVLLDLSLGAGPGTELLDHLQSRAADYRIIVLTAHEKLLTAGRARKYDVFAYLAKAENAAESLRFSVEQAFTDLERQALDQKLRRLLEIQRSIYTNQGLNETLDLICQGVLATVGGYTCHIRVYDAGRGDYHLGGYAGESSLRGAFARPRAKGDLFSGVVVETREPATFGDIQHITAFAAFRRSAAEMDRAMSPTYASYFDTIRSAYIVPIFTQVYDATTIDAVLNVSSDVTNFFTAERRALVDEFVGQAALAITKTWLQAKRQELHHDYADLSSMLSDVSERLIGAGKLQNIYNVLTRRVAEIIGAEVVSVFLYDPESELLENVAQLRGDIQETFDEAYAPGQSLTGAVFSQKETIHLPHPGDDPRFDSLNREAFLRKIPSGQMLGFLGVPIRVGTNVRGVLRALNKKSLYYDADAENHRALLQRGFSPDDLTVLEIAANHLGVAIHNVELLHEKNRQMEQARALGEVARIINSETAIDDILKLTIEQMAGVMQAEVCLLFLVDENRLVLQQSFGLPPSLLEGAFYEIGEGVIGTVAATRTARLLRDVDSLHGKYDKQIFDFLADKHGSPHPIQSLMVVPVTARNHVIGVMKVINKTGEPFEYDNTDLQIFKTFADYVAVAIENAQLYEHTNERLAIAERNAALSQLVRAVAHEINNTVGLIPTTVDAIRAELDAPTGRVIKMLALLDDVAEEATDFANSIAGFSATRLGTKQVCDINEMIAQATRELGTVLDRYPGELDLSLSDQPLVCEVYPGPFKQVIRNVVLNAFQALDQQRNGVVRVTTRTGSGQWAQFAEVIVEDNGIGIPSEHLQKIFEADFTTKPNGNGLGLWLTQTQIQMLDGTMDVESELARGTTFIIRIPAGDPARTPS